jgi:hypothetical protein
MISMLQVHTLDFYVSKPSFSHIPIHANNSESFSSRGSLMVQGCQMVCFQTKNPNLGKFWRALDWKKLIYFFGHLGYFMEIWEIL